MERHTVGQISKVARKNDSAGIILKSLLSAQRGNKHPHHHVAFQLREQAQKLIFGLSTTLEKEQITTRAASKKSRTLFENLGAGNAERRIF